MLASQDAKASWLAFYVLAGIIAVFVLVLGVSLGFFGSFRIL